MQIRIQQKKFVLPYEEFLKNCSKEKSMMLVHIYLKNLNFIEITITVLPVSLHLFCSYFSIFLAWIRIQEEKQFGSMWIHSGST